MLEQEFQGWTGWVRYSGNHGHERIYDMVQILEFVDGGLEYRGEITNIADRYVNYTNVDSMGYVLRVPFKFWDSEVASDGIVTHNIPVAIITVIFLISFLMVAYISFYVVFIVVGKTRDLKSIQNSSPALTCIIICGNYFLVLTGIFFISNDRIVRSTGQEFRSNVSGETSTTEVCDNDTCKFLCMFPVYLLLVASSIMFGAMMSKAALIYVVVVKFQVKHNKNINTFLAISWPFLLATIDTLFVFLWSLVGPLVMKSEVLLSGFSDSPFFRVIQCGLSSQSATSTNVFVSILIVYKSCVVLFGLVMAYNLRNVQRQILRYGNTISWTMYNVTIFTLILILSFFLIQNFDVKLSIVSFLILATVFLTVTIIGFPLVYYSIPVFKTKVEQIDTGIKSKIEPDKKMLENSNAALQRDNNELKNANGEMVRRLTISGIDFPTKWNKSISLDTLENENTA